MPAPDLEPLRDAWAAAWPRALGVWSKFTKLSDPRWCLGPDDARRHGLAGSFAMIRLTDQAVVIGLEQIRDRKLDCFAAEILAHEIGHHVYCPASLLDQGRMLARMRRGLPGKEHLAPLIANLYADLLINDRLQRDAGLDLAGVYRAVSGVRGSAQAASPLGAGESDRLWTLYMRIYEILWGLTRGSLAAGKSDRRLEGDAQLGARLVRSYARDWLDGAGRFAALCLPYVMEDDGAEVRRILEGWLDIEKPGA